MAHPQERGWRQRRQRQRQTAEAAVDENFSRQQWRQQWQARLSTAKRAANTSGKRSGSTTMAPLGSVAGIGGNSGWG